MNLKNNIITKKNTTNTNTSTLQGCAFILSARDSLAHIITTREKDKTNYFPETDRQTDRQSSG
jgi:hypothetical protein